MSPESSQDLAIVVLSTAPDRESAETIAQALIGERLAACVSRVPQMISLYQWQGQVEEVEECLLVIKTHSRVAPRLTQRLTELHPYEVPEILVLPVAAGHRGYLDWIREATEQAD